MRPPLSATPGGVTSDQWGEPGAVWNSSQNVLFGSERSPMGRVTHESVDVEKALTNGASPVAWAEVAARPLPSSASRITGTPRRRSGARIGRTRDLTN